MLKNYFLTAGLLSGTIIGAGIFSLPYIVSRVGLGIGLFYLIAFSAVYFAIYLMYAAVMEKNETNHQFFYFAKKYLPQRWSNLASFTILIDLILILTVYLILAPVFTKLVFGSGGIPAILIFWFLSSIFIFAKLKVLDLAEFLGIVCILAIVFIIFIAGLGLEFKTPVFKAIDLPLFFLPFGPFLFSLAGRPAIPKVVEEYRSLKHGGKKVSLGKIIFLGTLIPVLVYFVFILGILRLNPNATPEALNGLGGLPPFILILLGFLGLVTIWTSYFIIGINIKDILRIDLKKSALFSASVALFAPLIFYFLGFKNFLAAVSFTGGIFLSLEGIFVTAMWRKAFPESKWRRASLFLYLVFFSAMAYEVISFVF